MSSLFEETTLVMASLTFAAWLYWRGTTSLWKQAGRGRGISRLRAFSFALGLTVLAPALIGPLAEAAHRTLTAHMVQHQLIMLVCAPLLVMGKPMRAFLWSVDRTLSPSLVRWQHRLRIHLFTGRPVAALLLVVVLWIWHLPAVYEAAARNQMLHAIEHVTFFLAAAAFWASLTRGPTRRLIGSVVSLALVGMATTMLSALLLFAGVPLYPGYASAAGSGSAALADQQAAALIMWLPSSLVGLAVAVVLLGRWLGADRGHAPHPGSVPASNTTP